MKDIAGAVVVFFLCLFAFTKFVGPIPLSISSVTTQKTDSFTVRGEGKVSLTPDIAVLHAGVTAEGATVKRVQDELSGKMNAISAAVKQLGVDIKDMQTGQYNISPEYDYSEPTQRITGYRANSNLTIKVRNLKNASKVIDAATANGANQISDISFDVDDKTAAENKARILAVSDAKSKAQAAAKAAGFKLGRVINYSEGETGFPRPYMMEKTTMMTDEAGAPTQVEPGTNELTVTVSLSYELQ